MSKFILISVSGLLGVWLRYAAGQSVEKALPYFWMSTLVINIIGSMIAGILFALSTEKAVLAEATATILLIGFCGGFTTFSAYSLQSYQLINQGHYVQVAIYFFLSPIVGLLATYLGVLMVRSAF
jgi:CrcB protein